jgi:hypothetical protein
MTDATTSSSTSASPPAKKVAKPCPHCRRASGDRKVSKCPRCPGQPVSASLLERCTAATIVAVDPGKASGWAIFHAGRPYQWGACDPFTVAPDEVLAVARELAERAGTALHLVGEAWGRGGVLNISTVEGLAATWGIWRRCAGFAGVPVGRRWRIHMATWRAVHGGKTGTLDSDGWKLWALERARDLARAEIRDANAAEAILIGDAALRLPDLVDRTPARVLARFASRPSS